MWKDNVGQEMAIWRMSIAGWTPKAINTYTEFKLHGYTVHQKY